HAVADARARAPAVAADAVLAGVDASVAARTIQGTPALKEGGLDALLAYAALRRGSLIEGFFDDGSAPLDPVSPWAAARYVLAAARLDCAVREAPDGVSVVLSRAATADLPAALEKRVTIRDATLQVDYRLGPAAGGRLT